MLARRGTWLSTNPPMLGLKLGVLTEPEGLCVCGVAFVMVRVGGERCRSPPHGRIGGVSLVCVWVGVCVCVCVFVRVCLSSVWVSSCVSDAFLVESTEALSGGNGDGVFGVSADSVTVW